MSHFSESNANELLTISNRSYVSSHLNSPMLKTQDDGLSHSTNSVPTPPSFVSPRLYGYQTNVTESRVEEQASVTAQPVWDRDRRELRLDDVLVKRFKWPATNQERILNAFQDNGWPRKISDPLDVDPKICPKRRLHDTIKCLNRKQLCGAIKFRGDGTGQGVLLEINLVPE